MSSYEIFFLTLGFTLIAMYRIWIWAVKIENFGIVDAAWSAGFLVHVALFCYFADGALARKIIFFLMIGLWSFRLAYYLSTRIYKHHPEEDTRYAQLRKDYGDNYKTRFLYFFMFQAVSISILTLPFIFVFKNTNDSLGLIEYVGLAAFAISLFGETIADFQLNSFKLNPANKGKVCNVGLWKYSRHPNYFFEACIWFSFFIFMLGTSGLIWSIYSPLIILFLLLKVTGVPPSEAQSLKSRGEAYKEYQQKTSVFIPWFTKK
jgi:steroid 5-alpha reductase family enzyme